MSSTAVIITGQVRTLKHCFPTAREAIYRKLEDPHFFVSVAPSNDPGAAEALNIMRRWVVEKYGESHWHTETIEQPPLLLDDQLKFEAAAQHAPWVISVPVIAIYRQFWHLARGWDFFCERKAALDATFDTFLRIRPDLHVHNFTKPANDYVIPPIGLGDRPRKTSTVYAPWWGSWGGCPDRMAYIVGEPAALTYFNVFHVINELLAEGCAFHPETMLARALERAGVRLKQTLDAEFTTIRTADDKRPHDIPSYSNRDVFRYVNERLAEE